MSNFDECLKIILHHEGGYVNHPKDPGGETNLGVTKRVYEEFGGEKDMRDLTVEDVAPIYKKGYWDRVKGDSLPEGLDLCVFDFGVNAEGVESAIGDYQDARQSYYEKLSTFDTFGRGWTRRVKETTSEAYKMAGIYLPS